MITALQEFMEACVQDELIQPLCMAVESDLRVHVHYVLIQHRSPPNPKSATGPARGAMTVPTHILRLPPLRIVQRELDIRRAVQTYLEQRFYEATTVALHDWKTYGEMAALASDKYGLELVDSHLPMGSLDTSVDVL